MSLKVVFVLNGLIAILALASAILRFLNGELLVPAILLMLAASKQQQTL